MKNIVIAAGYATRLGELTKNFPKPLLKIGENTILGRMLDDIDGIPEIDEHIIITNHRFAHIFEDWKKERQLSIVRSALPLGSSKNCQLSIALDGIQDPGNLGTIIRIADWFGIRDIICSEDTVDAWNPKVVQATMGSIARVNIIYFNLPQFIDTLPHDYPVYGTLLDGENIYTQSLTSHGLIVMGNEGNGISPEVRSRVNRRLLIPSYRTDDTAESLNVAIATAITCSEFRRRINA